MYRVVVMGVTGCGKTTVGMGLAAALDVPFVDGDDLHPDANIAKMRASVPLNDDDRWPWLADVGRCLAQHTGGVVVTCSALRVAYRDVLRAHAPDLRLVHLAAPQEVLEGRVRERAVLEGHFAGPGLLDSQYATLEPPEPDEHAVTVDVSEVDPVGAVARALEEIQQG